MKFLDKIVRLIHKSGFYVINVDATLIAEAPRLAPYRMKMEDNISTLLEIDNKYINVKATTTEGLGFEGRGLGIAARCVALIQKKTETA